MRLGFAFFIMVWTQSLFASSDCFDFATNVVERYQVSKVEAEKMTELFEGLTPSQKEAFIALFQLMPDYDQDIYRDIFKSKRIDQVSKALQSILRSDDIEGIRERALSKLPQNDTEEMVFRIIYHAAWVHSTAKRKIAEVDASSPERFFAHAYEIRASRLGEHANAEDAFRTFNFGTYSRLAKMASSVKDIDQLIERLRARIVFAEIQSRSKRGLLKWWYLQVAKRSEYLITQIQAHRSGLDIKNGSLLKRLDIRVANWVQNQLEPGWPRVWAANTRTIVLATLIYAAGHAIYEKGFEKAIQWSNGPLVVEPAPVEKLKLRPVAPDERKPTQQDLDKIDEIFKIE